MLRDRSKSPESSLTNAARILEAGQAESTLRGDFSPASCEKSSRGGEKPSEEGTN